MSDKKTKVLLIDDSSSARRVYRRFLESGRLATPPLHVDVQEAETGELGIAACKADRPDCIILDFKLPDTDGLKVISELRKYTQSPIIFVTGQPMPLTQTQAYSLGVVKYLSKDFVSSESLQSAVREAVQPQS